MFCKEAWSTHADRYTIGIGRYTIFSVETFSRK